MARAVGVDPGTKSFDVVLIDGDRVVAEESIDTVEVATNPHKLIEALEKLMPFDVVAGPSGYGVPVTWNSEIVDPERFAIEVLLLSTKEDIEEGVKRGELGVEVYAALAKVVVELWQRKLPVVYIPSIVLLPTIPLHRKLNRVDMGTADKLAVAFLAVHDYASRHSVDYSEVDIVVVELGFGYNAAIAISRGKIVDAVGGTTASIGFLTAGALDLEIVAAGQRWSRSDVFYGGVATVCRSTDIDEVVKRFEEGEEPCASAFRAFIEGVAKDVAKLLRVVKPKEILVSGRYARHAKVFKLVVEALEDIAPVSLVRGLEGARISKEAAQGYAAIAEGLVGGFFSKLVKHMEIDRARGTVFDYVYHPKLLDARERLKRAYLESVRNPKL